MYVDCADVLVASVLSDPLLYVIPQNLIDVIHRGTIVLVPLGRMKVLGVVIRVYTADIDSVGFCVKEITVSIMLFKNLFMFITHLHNGS